MATMAKDVFHSKSFRYRIFFLFWITFALISSMAEAGGKGNNQSGMEKLLAAGLIAKALAKGGEDGGGGGGGGHHFMPIHIPIHSGGGGSHHHHVHHKYVPIPVKHHTNFIIAHHKVPVPVHVPVPVVKTKVVHVPVEKTKIVPIIVHKGHHHHPHSQYGNPYSPSSPSYRSSKGLAQASSASTAAGALTALASNAHDSPRQLRITSLGTVRKVKDQAKNGTAGSSLQYQRPTSRAPEKWIVVVKNKRRPSTRSTTIRRLTSAPDNMTADTKVIPRVAVPVNSTAISTAGPRR